MQYAGVGGYTCLVWSQRSGWQSRKRQDRQDRQEELTKMMLRSVGEEMQRGGVKASNPTTAA